MIPDGPLHPDDAIVALLTGLLLAVVAGRTRMAGPSLVAGAAVVLAVRQPSLVPEGLSERPAPAVAIGAAVVVACILAALLTSSGPASARTSLLVATAGCVGAWATAPDTEPALIAGVTLLAAVPFVGRDARVTAPVVTIAPALAAVIGTVGRPERLPLVLAAAVTAAIAVWIGDVGRRWLVRRQRAGTPTTVAPGATSAVTTAPAPTTAP